jgi:hypothetical protein
VDQIHQTGTGPRELDDAIFIELPSFEVNLFQAPIGSEGMALGGSWEFPWSEHHPPDEWGCVPLSSDGFAY